MLLLALLLSLISAATIWIWAWGLAVRRRVPRPQAIFVLGGRSEREKFAAQFARQHPTLSIWLSSGMGAKEAMPLFQQAGIPLSQVHFDRRALDTVTNFTTLVGDFRRLRLRHLYLVTSDFHMPRARAIAFWVLGSRGIVTTPVIVPAADPGAESPEAVWRTVRDVGRSLLWLVTGKTGQRLGQWSRR